MRSDKEPFSLKARINYSIDIYTDDYIEVKENGFYSQWNFKRGDKVIAGKILEDISKIFGVEIEIKG